MEESKCHKLIEKHFPRVKADKMLADLSSIALEWAKNCVRQRQTFKLNTKGENIASLAFQHAPCSFAIASCHPPPMTKDLSSNLWTRTKGLVKRQVRAKRPLHLNPKLRSPPFELAAEAHLANASSHLKGKEK
jgi:hypothetical protein